MVDRDIAGVLTDEELLLGPAIGAVAAADEHDRDEREDAESAREQGAAAREYLLSEGERLLFGRYAGRLPGEGGGLLGGADRHGASAAPAPLADRGGGTDDLGGGRGGFAGVVGGEVEDVGDDDGDVVAGAGLEGDVDAAIGGGGRVGGLGEHLVDDLGADEVGEPVRAQQIAVADLEFADRQVGLVVGVAGHHPGDQRALRVVLGLLRGDPVLVDELLDEGVVLGDLGELALTQQIGPAVADVGSDELGAGAEHRDRRGPHAAEVGVFLHRLSELGVCFAQLLAEHAQGGLAGQALVIQRRQRPDNHRARDVARGVPAHAVGQDEQVRTGIPTVLVAAFRAEAEVGAGRVAQGDRHGSVAPQPRSSMVVRPMRSVEPTATGWAPVRR